ncbi:hypothetical protein Y032_0195g1487 [Ancylostoma ceylanicum]|uniref:Uncharacterized protein n=1 Tax=Ancylostoma ceylanicum TaxID=53326 RepID=A0A016SNQ1_9BILA|nr:hypothetical protein Y032_0195g1487 [Ancylostoma ceylanicum]
MQLEDWVPRGTTPMTPNITEQEDTNTTTGGTFAISGEIYGLIIPLIIAIATISIICSNLYLGLTRDSPPKKKTPKPVKEKSKTSKAASAPKTTSAESKSKEAMTKSPETTTKSKESAEKLGSAESGTSKSAESIHKMKP